MYLYFLSSSWFYVLCSFLLTCPSLCLSLFWFLVLVLPHTHTHLPLHIVVQNTCLCAIVASLSDVNVQRDLLQNQSMRGSGWAQSGYSRSSNARRHASATARYAHAHTSPRRLRTPRPRVRACARGFVLCGKINHQDLRRHAARTHVCAPPVYTPDRTSCIAAPVTARRIVGDCRSDASYLRLRYRTCALKRACVMRLRIAHCLQHKTAGKDVTRRRARKGGYLARSIKMRAAHKIAFMRYRMRRIWVRHHPAKRACCAARHHRTHREKNA